MMGGYFPGESFPRAVINSLMMGGYFPGGSFPTAVINSLKFKCNRVKQNMQ